MIHIELASSVWDTTTYFPVRVIPNVSGRCWISSVIALMSCELRHWAFHCWRDFLGQCIARYCLLLFASSLWCVRPALYCSMLPSSRLRPSSARPHIFLLRSEERRRISRIWTRYTWDAVANVCLSLLMGFNEHFQEHLANHKNQDSAHYRLKHLHILVPIRLN